MLTVLSDCRMSFVKDSHSQLGFMIYSGFFFFLRKLCAGVSVLIYDRKTCLGLKVSRCQRVVGDGSKLTRL